MNRTSVFSFRLSIVERRIIAELATKLQRSQSDAVRVVVIQAAQQLLKVDDTCIASQSMENLVASSNGEII